MGIRPVKTERGAELHVVQLMPLPLTVSCFSKIQIGFNFLVPAHPGSPGKGPLNGCVCIGLFSCIVASQFNRLTFLLNYSFHSSTLGSCLVRSSSPMWTNLYIGRSAAIGLPAPLSAPLFLLSAAVWGALKIGRRNDLMISRPDCRA